MLRVLYPAGALVSLPVIIPTVVAQEEKKKCPKCCRGLPRASELPLYDNAEDSETFEIVNIPPGKLQNGISSVRKTVSHYLGSVGDVTDQVKQIMETGIAHSKSSYDYITSEGNALPRAAAITAGGLGGLLFAARGGIVKKVIYSGTGLLSVAAICYPKMALERMESGYNEVKEFTLYNVNQYTGYDLKNISLENVKSALDIGLWTKKSPSATIDQIGQQPSSGDIGQNNPEDKDLYTTRSSMG